MNISFLASMHGTEEDERRRIDIDREQTDEESDLTLPPQLRNVTVLYTPDYHHGTWRVYILGNLFAHITKAFVTSNQ